MSRLSVEARNIVRAVSMLGNVPIPGKLMKETLHEMEKKRKIEAKVL